MATTRREKSAAASKRGDLESRCSTTNRRRLLFQSYYIHPFTTTQSIPYRQALTSERTLPAQTYARCQVPTPTYEKNERSSHPGIVHVQATLHSGPMILGKNRQGPVERVLVVQQRREVVAVSPVCVVFNFLTHCPHGQQPFFLQSTLTRPQLTGSQTGPPLSPPPQSAAPPRTKEKRGKSKTDERKKEKSQYGRACTNRRTTSTSSHPPRGL